MGVEVVRVKHGSFRIKNFFCWFPFLVFFAFALTLRFYKLGEVPVGLNRDEASIGYTAYSLLQTGKDEYGQSLPLSFKSFGDWKLPLYPYLTIPFVEIFGLSEFSVRLPSALAGVLTVIVAYFLVKSLLPKDRKFGLGGFRFAVGEVAGLLTSFFLAVSPWHLHFSRAAYEVNVALCLVVFGVYFLVKSFQKSRFLFLASFCLGLTLFTYHGAHVFIPPLVIGLALVFRKKFTFNRNLVLAFLLFLILAFVSFRLTLFEADVTKVSGIGIFSDPVSIYTEIDLLRGVHSGLWGRVFHNKLVFFAASLFKNYLNSFSFNFLYFEGGNHPIHNIPHFGNFYKIEVLFLISGLIYLLREKLEAKGLILLWLFLAPLPSNITKDAPNSARLLFSLPPILIIEALGVVFLLDYLRREKKRLVFCFLSLACCFLFLVEVVQFIDFYFVHFPRERAINWGGEYRDLVSFVSS